MMTYDKFLRRGLEGQALWDTIKHRCATHNDMLDEMRTRQQQLAAYAKMGINSSERINGLDKVQHALIQDVKFLETMAWRVYMFGNRSLFSAKPGSQGELCKRVRNDTAFHKLLSSMKMQYGPPGCQFDESGFDLDWSASIRLKRRPCLMQGCRHFGANKALKSLKATMRQEWERTVLRRYAY